MHPNQFILGRSSSYNALSASLRDYTSEVLFQNPQKENTKPENRQFLPLFTPKLHFSRTLKAPAEYASSLSIPSNFAEEEVD